MKVGRYEVGPILRPYLEGGHYWSVWAWLLQQIQIATLSAFCTSRALPITANTTAQTLACVLTFAPSPCFEANFCGLCGARGGAWPPFITACSSS